MTPTCGCASHARGSEGTPNVVVTTPGQEKVSLDACLVLPVQALWAEGVGTLSSCCGHGVNTPSIVLAHVEDYPRARNILDVRDPRRIELSAWVRAVLGCSGNMF